MARAARPIGGSADTVAAIARADVAEYARATFRPEQATLVLVGDFDGAAVDELAGRTFGAWSNPAVSRVPAEQPSVGGTARLLLLDWPDAPQSTLRVAGAGITRADPRWPALFVANHAVGGSFSSRINTVLREEKGFTYGATSMLDSSRHSGVFSVSTAVSTAATAEAITDILRIVADAGGSLTGEEVATGVRAVTSSAPLGYERAEAVSGRVELLLAEQLPLDHVDANLRRIREVTTAQANAAYSEVIEPMSLTVLVVGDAAVTRPGLASIGYADLELLAPDWR
jgi:predicted Zn-dependent peptidase